MKFAQGLTAFNLILLCSCEQLKEFSSSELDENQTTTDSSPIALKNNQSDDPVKDDPPRPEEPPTVFIPQPSTPPIENLAPPQKPETKAEQPMFSDELLKAVNNWQSIPLSVFPLKSVTIQQAVKFVAKAPDGQVVATSIMQPGEEVVALGIQGSQLILSPNLSGKMRGIIALEQTDFKQGVAYLFELRKKQREDYELRKSTLAKQSKVKGTTALSEKTDKTDNSLFEDLPIPGDFGHGKFCICKDCREQRLAATGSMK